MATSRILPNLSVLTDTVPASSTKTVDTIVFSSFLAVKYIIVMFNTTEDKYKTIELLGSKVGGAEVVHNISAILGDNINISPNFSKSGADAILEFINGEAFDVDIKISRNLI